MIAVVDYGVGNLFSLASSLSFLGVKAEVTSDPARIAAADKVILPGVGAFGDAVQKLRGSGLFDTVKGEALSGKPFLGICLGMQLLFEKSRELGEFEGLGLLRGEVVPMKGVIPEGLDIPHIGWNALHFTKETPLFSGIAEGERVYFVHSYFARGCEDSLAAETEYGVPLTAAVCRGNLMGCQFHPEKSGKAGLKILENFAKGSFV